MEDELFPRAPPPTGNDIDCSFPPPASPTPVLLLNGCKIYTADREGTRGHDSISDAPEAVLIQGSRIVYTGSLEEARAFCDHLMATEANGRLREVILPPGSLVLPGFVDAHCHPLAAGTKEMMSATYCDVSQAAGAEEALEICRRYVAQTGVNGGGAWVLGGGWRDDWFPDRVPKAWQLDEVFGRDVPVMLRRWDMHACWCSTKALEVAGLLPEEGSDPSKPPPQCPKGGQIVLDGAGRPVGLLYDAAQDLIVYAIPPLSHEVRTQALRLAVNKMLSFGITGFLEALVKNERQLAVYQGLYDGESIATETLPWGCLALQCKSMQDVDLIKARRGRTGDRLELRMAKLMVDGVMESRTAALHAPYLEPYDSDHHQGSCCCSGTLNFATEELQSIVRALDSIRVPIHCHCVGDRATTEVLDAIEAAQASGDWEDWDARHTIAHLQLMRPADLPRFPAMHVVANMTPYWLCATKEMETVINPSLGPPERANQQYPLRTLLDLKTRVSFGSDWPVDGVLNPLVGLEVAITHIAPGSIYPTWLPHQTIRLEEAIAAYTIDAAYACHKDDRTGSISVGKDADLVVLDKDIFLLPPSEIHTAHVTMTLVKGKIAYSREAT